MALSLIWETDIKQRASPLYKKNPSLLLQHFIHLRFALSFFSHFYFIGKEREGKNKKQKLPKLTFNLKHSHSPFPSLPPPIHQSPTYQKKAPQLLHRLTTQEKDKTNGFKWNRLTPPGTASFTSQTTEVSTRRRETGETDRAESSFCGSGVNSPFIFLPCPVLDLSQGPQDASQGWNTNGGHRRYVKTGHRHVSWLFCLCALFLQFTAPLSACFFRVQRVATLQYSCSDPSCCINTQDPVLLLSAWLNKLN